jgi:DNA-binding PadR family transcriptional regulator
VFKPLRSIIHLKVARPDVPGDQPAGRQCRNRQAGSREPGGHLDRAKKTVTKRYLGTFEQAVLLALASLEGDAGGMSIVDALVDAGGREVSVPAVYVTLKRLENKGLVASEVRDDDGDGPPRRKFFTLLPAGVAELTKTKDLLESLWTRVSLERLGGKA